MIKIIGLWLADYGLGYSENIYPDKLGIRNRTWDADLPKEEGAIH